jgi:nucleoside-diphosphate-sugar epimerase
MKVLVLGGSGYIGSRLCAMLAESGWATPVSASRHAVWDTQSLPLEATDADQLKRALRGMDAVVNCVAGSAQAIAQGARVLVQAANESGCRRIVHLSTMSVYGALEGEVREDAPRDANIGWYAKAKCEAEDAISAFALHGGSVVMLRPGCVWGPGSELWVGRIGRLLRAHRLGDLGAAGDGWSNLVALQDVCAAILASLRLDVGGAPLIYNLAAPDSPRWNGYFVDLALAIDATPVRRLSPRQLKLDAKLASPCLKLTEILLKKAGRATSRLPDPLPPGLLGVFERHLHLRGERAQHELGLRWTPYDEVLPAAAAWFMSTYAPTADAARRAVQVPRT